MIKHLYIQYKIEDKLSSLTVADLEEKLPNGNNKVIKILIGDYADEIYEALTADTGKGVVDDGIREM